MCVCACMHACVCVRVYLVATLYAHVTWQLKLVEEYMKYHRIPPTLKTKVRTYFYHRYHGRLFNEQTMLKELSHVLEKVCLHVHGWLGVYSYKMPPLLIFL